MKFKVGDRVEVIAATMSICGEIGTISDVRFLSKNGNGPIVMVTLDRNHEDPWWLYEDQVEFVPANGVQRMIECL
jgi:hypothetical protein